jgi:hypothetical protein
VLKFIFWLLLCLNGVLLAYGQGYLGAFKGGEREPARMQNQLAPEKLSLVTQAQAAAASVPAQAPAEVEAPVEPAPPARTFACTELGPFSSSEARRFETRIERLELGNRQSQVSAPFQEVSSRLVYIPSLGSKEAAEQKAAELRGLGVTNFFIISSADSPHRWGISLGLFKSESSAQALLSSLAKQGVHGARIAARGPTGTRTVYKFRDVDEETRSKIIGIGQRIAGDAQVRNCK